MIGRRHQVALALTAVLTAAAACSQQVRQDSGRGGAAGPPAARHGFTLVATGDILTHPAVLERASADASGGGYDFRPMLSGVEPLVHGADLALCHLEDGIGGAAPLSPPQLAQDLAMTGYDGCATASEHALDNGADGIRGTLDTLDAAGLRHVGTARGADESRRPARYRAGSATVAQLSYTFDTERPLPDGQPWALGPIDADRITADARAARKAGADVVVLSLHWGANGDDAPTEDQAALARRLTAAADGRRPDIDLILGSHTHVPQPYEKVNGTWVVYGLGDQISDELDAGDGSRDPRGNESTLARFTFAPPARAGERWQVTRAEFVPQMYDLDAGRVLDVNRAVAGGADLAGVRDRIRDVVLSRGAADDGLVMGE
ncbi:CapA family protein [Streptomyces sp. SUK 48]|uniref:CapA family protein n=1 Tax=Streptomyces sp. SUK 48 TaxID=2582831 RepID=UPI00129B4D49|nr:CapA family protein [Streptomyces sp. SUK 48]